MKIQLTEDEIQKLFKTEYPCNQDQELDILESLPLDEGEWALPDFAVEIIREVTSQFIDKSIFEKMEAQTIRGVVKIDLSSVDFG